MPLRDSYGSGFTAVILGDLLEASHLQAFIGTVKMVVSRLVVVSEDSKLDQLDVGSEPHSIVYHRVSKSDLEDNSRAVREGIAEALRVWPETERILILTSDGGPLPSASHLLRIARSKWDFERTANCLILSKRYATFVASSDGTPSELQARKNGFATPSLISRLFTSPKDVIREYERLVTFGIVGLSGVVVNLIALFILKTWFGWINLVLSDAVAVELSIVNNFVWNDSYTFRDSSSRAGAAGPLGKFLRFVKYNAVSLVSTSVNLGVFYVLSQMMGVWYISADLVAILAAFAINYFGSSRWAWGSLTFPAQKPSAVLKN